jgi:hypothetical protein
MEYIIAWSMILYGVYYCKDDIIVWMILLYGVYFIGGQNRASELL